MDSCFRVCNQSECIIRLDEIFDGILFAPQAYFQSTGKQLQLLFSIVVSNLVELQWRIGSEPGTVPTSPSSSDKARADAPTASSFPLVKVCSVSGLIPFLQEAEARSARVHHPPG